MAGPASPPTDAGRIPLTVVGGYLGAGKTTVLNHVLGATSARLAVLVNDFGEIDIDTALITAHAGDTISLANGCVCCSLADGFLAALQTVRALDPPVDHVVVEASGVADPGQVAQWGHSPGFRLDGVVVVAAADAVAGLADDRYVGDTVRGQLRAADLVLLTKADLLADGGASVRVWLGTVTRAPVVDAPHGAVALPVLLGVGPEGGRPPAPAPSHPGYVTAAVDADDPVDRPTLIAALDDPPPGLLRAKGILRCADVPDRETVLQMVGRRHELRAGGPWSPGARARAVAIAGPASDPDQLADWLRRVVGRI